MPVAAKKNAKTSGALPDNALAKQALESIKAIEREAQEKKLAQVETLKSAKAALLERLNELNHQLVQIDKAIAAVTGEPVPTREKRGRRNLDDVRERVGRWLDGHRGQRFGAGDLVREFPELEGVGMSIFLKPLISSGKLQTDKSEGIRRMKYFVDDAG
jgi:hypothetical protein